MPFPSPVSQKQTTATKMMNPFQQVIIKVILKMSRYESIEVTRDSVMLYLVYHLGMSCWLQENEYPMYLSLWKHASEKEKFKCHRCFY